MDASSLIILIVVGGFVLNEIYQQKLGVAPMPTLRETSEAMLAYLDAAETGVIYELGSGWGKMAIEAAKKCPNAQVIGCEGSPLPLLVSHLRKIFYPGLKNLTFQSGNFFNRDLSDAQAILCYLSNPHMAKLEPKFKAELKPGSVIISSTFHMPAWSPAEVKTLRIRALYDVTLYVYRA